MTDNFQFKRARRIQARLRLALIAVSGAGKTMGSLRIAKGIVQTMIDTGQIEGPIDGKIAMIDTERKSASLYAHVCPFDTLELEPPYSVDRYQQALAAAERAGYVVCIIDQISHAWAGPGGQLEYVDTLKAGARNAMSPWAKVTPMQQEFYDRILRSPMHIIATMRAKTEYVIEEQIVDGRKKNVPRKIGLAPVQRDGIEYEFTTCLDIDLESHTATATKDRTSLFMDRSTKLDEDTGRRIAEWLVSGAAPAPEQKSNAEQQLEAIVEDYSKAFEGLATLPDLAAHFDKGQREIREFARGDAPKLGAEKVKPYLDKLITAKDNRKIAIEKAAAGGTKDLLGQHNLSVEQITRLATWGVDDCGLTDAEILKALQVDDLTKFPDARYDEAVEILKKAGEEKKKAAKPASRRRERTPA